MPATEPELRLYCFIDALGWELAQQHRFLESLLPHRGPLGTLLGYSSTCDPTILTGCWPREHGHFSFFYYDPQGSPLAWLRHLKWLPRSLTSRGRVRHWISRLAGRALGYTGYFQLYNVPFPFLQFLNYSEKRDIYQPGGINGGQSTFLDLWRQRGVRFHLSDWRRSEAENLRALAADIEGPTPPSRAYLYLAAMDAVLHRDGCSASSVAAKLKSYEQQLHQLVEVAGRRYQNVRLYLFSDHGMRDVSRCLDLRTPLERLPLVYGRDYVAVLDSTLARFWFLHDRARSLILDWLSQQQHGQILSDAQLAAWGCDFPGQKYGQTWFLADPGVLLCPGHLGERPLAAMHGYHPDDPPGVGFFGTNQQVTAPAHLTELYPLFCEGL